MSLTTQRKRKGHCAPLTNMYASILENAAKVDPYTRHVRRKLHMYPELPWQEDRTIRFILDEIRIMIKNSSHQFQITEKKGGIWVDLQIHEMAPNVLFRADIDALPIQEENLFDFASKIKGVMHACGHDCHVAMLLSALKIIAEGKITPTCNVRFVFQRAEEVGTENCGGASLVQDGVCEGIDYAYCLHVGGKEHPGVFFSKPGVSFCNPSTIEIELEASGGHVASPFIGTNTIDVLGSVISELRGIEKLLLPPTEPIIFVPTMISSGTASNIRPGKACATFALRSYLNDEKKELFIHQIRKKIESIVSSFDHTKLSRFLINRGYPILINDPRNTHFVSDCLHAMGQTTQLDKLSFAGDDFAYYLQKTCGSYWVLGAWQEGCHDHHTAKFNPNEDVLKQGVAFWLLLGCRSPARDFI